MEEFTPEIPNVSEERLKNLDENGLVRVGARVSAGDILIGKVTPKGETELTPEENLLRAIFGDRAGDVRDTSLKAPPGMNGIVIDTKLFSRRAQGRAKQEGRPEGDRQDQDRVPHRAQAPRERARQAHLRAHRGTEDQVAARRQDERTRRPRRTQGQRRGDEASEARPARLGRRRRRRRQGQREGQSSLRRVPANGSRSIEPERDRNIERVKLGEDLPRGVVKLAKVYVATKRKLSVGDKVAGRHGNKGVVAKIMAEEDMPYLPDGTPVDIVLNPLGVPSRMNLGPDPRDASRLGRARARLSRGDAGLQRRRRSTASRTSSSRPGFRSRARRSSTTAARESRSSTR